MKGKLYGIGVGPGDPELLTLKAKRLIEECDIVAVPVKKEGEDSVALNIAKGAVDIPEGKIREIVFTMVKDKAKREACRQAAAEEINKIFFEVIIAPDYDVDALEILGQKKNRIILVRKEAKLPKKQFRALLNGVLVQDKDTNLSLIHI